MSEDTQEATGSAAVPSIVKPFMVVKKRRPAALSGIVATLRKHKKRMASRFSKTFSPPNPSGI